MNVDDNISSEESSFDESQIRKDLENFDYNEECESINTKENTINNSIYNFNEFKLDLEENRKLKQNFQKNLLKDYNDEIKNFNENNNINKSNYFLKELEISKNIEKELNLNNSKLILNNSYNTINILNQSEINKINEIEDDNKNYNNNMENILIENDVKNVIKNLDENIILEKENNLMEIEDIYSKKLNEKHSNEKIEILFKNLKDYHNLVLKNHNEFNNLFKNWKLENNKLIPINFNRIDKPNNKIKKIIQKTEFDSKLIKNISIKNKFKKIKNNKISLNKENHIFCKKNNIIYNNINLNNNFEEKEIKKNSKLIYNNFDNNKKFLTDIFINDYYNKNLLYKEIDIINDNNKNSDNYLNLLNSNYEKIDHNNINKDINILLLKESKLTQYKFNLNNDLLYLDLSNNNLNNIECLESLNKLVYLDISNNNLNKLGIGLSKSLKILNVSKNNLENNILIPNQIENLNLSYNKIDEIELSNLKFLKIANLSFNKIKKLNFINNEWIEDLFLYSNLIEDIKLKKSSNLKYLNLENNKIKNIDLNEFTLEYLNLLDNPLNICKINVSLIKILKYNKKYEYSIISYKSKIEINYKNIYFNYLKNFLNKRNLKYNNYLGNNIIKEYLKIPINHFINFKNFKFLLNNLSNINLKENIQKQRIIKFKMIFNKYINKRKNIIKYFENNEIKIIKIQSYYKMKKIYSIYNNIIKNKLKNKFINNNIKSIIIIQKNFKCFIIKNRYKKIIKEYNSNKINNDLDEIEEIKFDFETSFDIDKELINKFDKAVDYMKEKNELFEKENNTNHKENSNKNNFKIKDRTLNPIKVKNKIKKINIDSNDKLSNLNIGSESIISEKSKFIISKISDKKKTIKIEANKKNNEILNNLYDGYKIKSESTKLAIKKRLKRNQKLKNKKKKKFN